MSSSETESANIPDAKTCDERCKQFASSTDTDTALAMFYLQDRDWDVERSVNAYFEQKGGSGATNTSDNSRKSATTTEKAAGHHGDAPASDSGVAAPSNKRCKLEQLGSKDSEPHRIRLLSWNIDGLDTNNIINRTKGVCKVIEQDNPDVVYLQEVVPQTLDLIEATCPSYQVIPGGNQGYFTAIMLKAGSVLYSDHSIKPFFSSIMERNILTVQASIKGVDCTLMTSHLESTKAHSNERKHQLKTALKDMVETAEQNTVIFGGDLNLRDNELIEIKGLPEGVLDLWEVTGKRLEAKFTWDLTRNDNLSWDARYRPKCRFDRLYIRHPRTATKSKPGGSPKLKPVYFELAGLERLESCKRFPSDHWGILAHFNII